MHQRDGVADVHGNNVPGCYASEAEVLAMAQAARRAGYAVYETAGAPGDKGLEGLLEIGKEVTVTFTLPEAGMSRSLEWLQKANAGDSTVIGQVFARAQGLLLGLEGVIQVRDDLFGSFVPRRFDRLRFVFPLA